mgnify:CR=1 FL=1
MKKFLEIIDECYRLKNAKLQYFDYNVGASLIFNIIIKENLYDSYLEIGKGAGSKLAPFKKTKSKCTLAGQGVTLSDLILCKNKTTIDIQRRFNPDYVMSSEEFFKHARKNKIPKYDFIHGLNAAVDYDTFKKSVYDSIEFLSNNGTLICDFADPKGKIWVRPLSQKHSHSMPAGMSGKWIGQVWKVLVEIQYDISLDVDVTIIRNDNHAVVSDDGNFYPGGFVHGMAIIRKKNGKVFNSRSFNKKFLDYDYYERNKNEIMNMISLQEFFEKYLKHDQGIQSSIDHWSKK